MAKLSISSQPTLLLFNIMQDIIEKQKKELTLKNIRANEASSIKRIDDNTTHETHGAPKPKHWFELYWAFLYIKLMCDGARYGGNCLNI